MPSPLSRPEQTSGRRHPKGAAHQDLRGDAGPGLPGRDNGPGLPHCCDASVPGRGLQGPAEHTCHPTAAPRWPRVPGVHGEPGPRPAGEPGRQPLTSLPGRSPGLESSPVAALTLERSCTVPMSLSTKAAQRGGLPASPHPWSPADAWHMARSQQITHWCCSGCGRTRRGCPKSKRPEQHLRHYPDRPSAESHTEPSAAGSPLLLPVSLFLWHTRHTQCCPEFGWAAPPGQPRPDPGVLRDAALECRDH